MSGKTGTGKSKSEQPEVRSFGRPSTYSDEIADEICSRMHESDGDSLPESLREICRDESMPGRSTVYRWLNEHQGFRDRYAHARELRKEALIDRILHLSRTALGYATGSPGTGEAGARVQAIKLEIDTIKWILSKEYSSDYGDRIRQELTGADGGPIQTATKERNEEDERRFAALLAAADQKARPDESAD